MSDLIQALSSFNRAERLAALRQLAASASFPQERPNWVNMHMHTFFSYNGEGWSPCRIAYEMKQLGLYAGAICDFDVLQGMDEFLEAADIVGLRSAVALESRVFFGEYADVEINSPGEPGVFYFMGLGFVHPPKAGTTAAQILASMLEQSHTRNRAVISRINAKIPDFQLDYDQDVLPLTPDKNATERHIIAAYNAKGAQTFGSTSAAAAAWSRILGTDPAQTAEKAGNYNAFNDFLRSKLMKKGGLGYVQPTRDTFPPLEKVIQFILDCRAIPMSAWLDGDSKGEADPMSQLECLRAKGVEAVNIIPDRNWNFKDPEVKARKLAHLADYVKAADTLGMPINVGTEGNKPGQRPVDGFDAPELAPYLKTFFEGAKVMVGHTRLLRYADFSYTDAKAKQAYPDVHARNAFFASVGALPCPSESTRQELAALSPEQAFTRLADAAKRGAW